MERKSFILADQQINRIDTSSILFLLLRLCSTFGTISFDGNYKFCHASEFVHRSFHFRILNLNSFYLLPKFYIILNGKYKLNKSWFSCEIMHRFVL